MIAMLSLKVKDEENYTKSRFQSFFSHEFLYSFTSDRAQSLSKAP